MLVTLFLAASAASSQATAADSTDSARRLAAIVARVDAHRTRDGLSALRRGHPVERLPQVTRAAWQEDAAFWRGIREGLRPLTDRELEPEERLTLRALQWEAGLLATRAPHYWVDFSTITPYASPLREVEQLLALHPLSTRDDRRRYLALQRQLGPWIDSIRAGIVARAARGIRLAREEVPHAVTLLRTYIREADRSAFRPSADRLGALEVSDRAAVTATVDSLYATQVRPSLEQLADYLGGEYLERAPARVGLAQYPGGLAYHRWLVRWHTTMEVTPGEVHQIGQREVARINREMAAIRAHVGFTGSKAEFHARLAKDPRFFATTPEAFGERLMSYARRLEPRLGEFFLAGPRVRGDVRRLAPELEPAMTFGFYQVPTPSDSMGHYFYNGSSLAERTLLTAGPLIAHELWPGHHFQVNLARENTTIPPARREGYYTAYGEGWCDYAAILAGEMGLYDDPMDRYGRLAMDMFIACRLVVDTGMNSLGWSLERARAFMRAHTLESETQIRSESLRYSTDLPGQALAYKMGSLEFERLRARARAALGARFDIRQFHDVVLGSGALPMGVLAEKVTWWIASTR